jgi:hypothetical protein
MTDAPAVTLEFLAEQQAKMLAEMADQRADIDTLLTIIQRFDAMVGSRAPWPSAVRCIRQDGEPAIADDRSSRDQTIAGWAGMAVG